MIPVGILASCYTAPPPPAGLSCTFLQTAGSGVDGSSFTFASQNLGAAASDRTIIVAVMPGDFNSRSISSVTVAGVTATLIAARSPDSPPIGIYRAAVPSGTTGNVVVTLSASVDVMHVALWRVTGTIAASNTATATAASVTSIGTTVTGYSGGVIIAALSHYAATITTPSFTWTNATKSFDYRLSGINHNTSGAVGTGVGSTAVSVLVNNTFTKKLVVVALGP